MAVSGLRLLIGEDYRSSLAQITGLANEASALLVEMFSDEHGESERYKENISKIKDACAEIAQGVNSSLSWSYFNAVDREDLHALTSELWRVVYLIETQVKAAAAYGVREYTPQMRRLASLIQEMTQEMKLLVSIVTKPRDIDVHRPEIRRLKRESREVYTEAIGALIREGSDTERVIIRKDLYENLNETLGSCLKISSLYEVIAIKNA